MKLIVSVAALAALVLADDKFITVSTNGDNTDVSGTLKIGANTFNPCYLAVSSTNQLFLGYANYSQVRYAEGRLRQRQGPVPA